MEGENKRGEDLNVLCQWCRRGTLVVRRKVSQVMCVPGIVGVRDTVLVEGYILMCRECNRKYLDIRKKEKIEVFKR